jgi:hypothetical protein
MFDADLEGGLSRWAVVRLRGQSRTSVILLSRKFFAIATHWVGHTVPCCGEQCALCETLVCRGLFYVCAICDGRQSMLELGSLSASHLEQHCKLLHSGVRPGLVVELWRKSNKSPIHSEVSGFREGCMEVDQLTLASHVMALYKFPPHNPGDTIEDYEKRCRTVSRLRNRQLAERLKTSGDRRV